MKRVSASQDQPSVPAEAVRAQLDRILACHLFAGSDRLCRFLRFTVERTLEGQADQLKEYALGVDVFDRKASFDPRAESIVRVEAVRLRSRLEQYYQNEGANDPVRIGFGKGGYAPVFQWREPAALRRRWVRHWKPAAVVLGVLVGNILTYQPASLFWRRVTGERAVAPLTAIAVLPFADLSAGQDLESFADGLTEELINRLNQAGGLRVVARTSVIRFKGQTPDVRRIGADLKVGSVLEGNVRRTERGLHVTARLVAVSDGFPVWSETYKPDSDNLSSVQDEAARAIVEAVRRKLRGQP